MISHFHLTVKLLVTEPFSENVTLNVPKSVGIFAFLELFVECVMHYI